ncbi:MAG TPA: pantetheine-phosphate adenylyltransferase [Rickettsiales bacterium]|nr:pantetheine-phosphate adenylyltransferase [Rickettsiales bacterium]
MKTVAIYPGTFDPITKGHLDVIIRASKIVGTLIVAVAQDTGKNPIFSQQERVELVEADVNELKLENVKVIPFCGLLVNFLKQQKADFIIRGLRTISDFENEFTMAAMNRKLYNNIETIFLPAIDSTQFISSTFVRQISKLGGDIEQFVSSNVKAKIKEKFSVNKIQH